jgi:type I restriction enzyme, S subunit
VNTVRLKHVAEVRYGLGQPPPAADDGVPILRATNIHRGRINPEGMVFAALDDLPLSRCPLLAAGEVLVVRSGAYTGDSALVTDEWAGSAPGYDLRLTPRAINPRFLAYQMLSSRVLDEIALAKMRAAQPHLNAEDLGNIEIMISTPTDEGGIADYLDVESGRIEKLITWRRLQLSLLDERLQARIDDRLTAASHGPGARTVPLKRLVDPLRPITYGIVQAGPHQPEGVPYIRPVDMHAHSGIPDPALLQRTTPEIAASYSRSTVRTGDVIVTIGPSYGKTMIVPRELDGANLTQGTARVAPRRGVKAKYVVWALRHSQATTFWDSAVGGATFHALNLEPLSRTPVLEVPESAQLRLIAELEHDVERHEHLARAIGRQVRSLAERRQALITAAVTGELVVPGVAA